MTVTLELPPDVEATLLAKAEAEGKPVSDYIQDLVRKQMEPMVPKAGAELPAYELPYEEWRREFHAFLDRQKGNTVVLSEEAYDRESIYGDHGV